MRIWIVVMQDVILFCKQFRDICVNNILLSLVKDVLLLICRKILFAINNNVLIYILDTKNVIDAIFLLEKHV